MAGELDYWVRDRPSGWDECEGQTVTTTGSGLLICEIRKKLKERGPEGQAPRLIRAPECSTHGKLTQDRKSPPSEGMVMPGKGNLQEWVLEAIESLGGGGTVVEVSREVWRRHEGFATNW